MTNNPYNIRKKSQMLYVFSDKCLYLQPMSNVIHIDPVTRKEFIDTVHEAFESVVDEMKNTDFSKMSYQEIAELFFANGFFVGCMAMTDNEDLKETIYMMSKEIEYQTKK